MIIIGITGNSGAGKTFVTEEMSKILNAYVLDADNIAKELNYKNSPYQNKIINLFGDSVLEDGEFSRKNLANIIYNNKEQKEQLDKITFYYVLEEMRNIIEAHKENFEFFIIDAPLLFEAKINEKCNFVISVIANEETKLARIVSRDKIYKEEAIKRLSIQANDEFFINNSNFVIENNQDNNIYDQINKIIKEIKKLKRNESRRF